MHACACVATNYIATAKKEAMEHVQVLNHYAHLTKAKEQANEPPRVIEVFKVQGKGILYDLGSGDGPQKNFET